MQPTPSVFGACLGSASLLSGVTIAAKLETRCRNHQPAMFERLLVALRLTLLFLACGGRAARPANTSSAPDSSQAQPSGVVAAGRIEDYTSGEPKQFVREKFWLARGWATIWCWRYRTGTRILTSQVISAALYGGRMP